MNAQPTPTPRPSIRCRHCSGFNLLPLAPEPSPLTPADIDAVIRVVIDELTEGTKQSSKIGDKCQFIEFHLQQESQIVRLRQQILCESLNAGPASVSRRLARTHVLLVKMRTAIAAALQKSAP